MLESIPTHSAPQVGSAAGWPLVVYFHRVRTVPRHYTAITPSDLACALDLLAERFAPLDPHAVSRIAAGDPPAAPTCLVTFDDGAVDCYEHAAPALEARGWRAMFFVNTDEVGDSTERGCMSWQQLGALGKRGHAIASHGASHRDLSRLPHAEVDGEVARARAALAARLGSLPDILAFPYGNIPRCEPDRLPPVCFGSVKAQPQPWDDAPRAIRRTYFPTAEAVTWPSLVRRWWEQCRGEASR